LGLDELINILTQVKNCYVKQYQWLFAQDEIKLEFDQDALEAIAKRAQQNKTGARGLHSELERVLIPHMFDLKQYKDKDLDQILINADLVNNPRTLISGG
jgi:ATP-dependent Clp protease ATP-binding subunit ClpX